MAESRVYVFNQYYWDFIKKIKDFAKVKRNATTDDGSNAKAVYNGIKQHYAIFDKMSPIHLDKVDGHLWKTYGEAEPETLPGIFESDTAGFKNAPLLTEAGITFGQIQPLIPGGERIMLHQYWTLFGILSDPETDVRGLLDLMKQFKLNEELKPKLDALPEDCGLKRPLMRLYGVFEASKTASGGELPPFMEEIEKTSLGRLAKEIMGEINLDDLQPDMLNSGGGLLDMLMGGGSGAGLGKVISTVSQKMMSKMSSGELNQEELLKDALGVAAKLPGMMPGGAGGLGGDLAKMGDMLSMFAGDSGRGGPTAPGGFDLSSLMSMMGGLSAKQAKRASRDSRVKNKLSGEMKRQKMAEKLRKKMEERSASKSDA